MAGVNGLVEKGYPVRRRFEQVLRFERISRCED